MSLARLQSRASDGLDALPVSVEIHLLGGLPSFTIVGLPEAAVRESREGVRGALINSSFDFPVRRITANLAPADIPKQGGRFDLPIALGILAASGKLCWPSSLLAFCRICCPVKHLPRRPFIRSHTLVSIAGTGGADLACLTKKELGFPARLDSASESFLEAAVRQLGLSLRGHYRILKVTRTIADLKEAETLREEHFTEALQYRATNQLNPGCLN